MKCVECNRTSETVFFVEIYPCPTCDDQVEVEYHACKHCGTVWKTANGEPMDYAKSKIKDFSDIVKNHKKFEDFFSYMAKDDNDIASMNQVIHRCLQCNHIAYETSDGNYECPDCGFTWEVL